MWENIGSIIFSVVLLALGGFLLWKLVTKILWPLLKKMVWFFPASICIICWMSGQLWVGILSTVIVVGIYILMFWLKNRYE